MGPGGGNVAEVGDSGGERGRRFLESQLNGSDRLKLLQVKEKISRRLSR